MPEISRFFGIVIKMYFDEHPPPHFHAISIEQFAPQRPCKEVFNHGQCKQLIVYINTSLPVEATLSRMDRLDREWFLDPVKSIGHLINFNLEVEVSP